MTCVAFDRRAVTIDGQRTLLLSGAVHYPRSTPAMWPDLMRETRAAGLNTVETYVFWNLHERRRGVLDFSDRLDLVRFCRAAQEAGLHVILRIGPYICAETNYGGLPPWLRDVPGIRMRTWNQPFMAEMDRWVRALCEVMRPMFAPAGGPIILAQIENEYANVARQYGDDGQRYLAWSVDLGRSLDLGVPWVMCYGGAPGAIETINGGWPHTSIDDHFRRHPDMPALCTELWPGWYDLWGRRTMGRTPESLASAVARFVAAGGTGFNYYMWHAGTNFGRETMYLQKTHYGFSTLDEFGRPTTVTRHAARLHHLLAAHADALLSGDRAAPAPLGEKQAAWVYGQGDGRLVFLSNDDEAAPAAVTFEGRGHTLAPQSVLLVGGGGEVLMDTARVDASYGVRRRVRPLARSLGRFERWDEPLPGKWPEALGPAIVAPKPVEQLALTRDETDYCWYSVDLTVAKREAGGAALVLDGAADLVYVYVDGRLVAATPTPLEEDRGLVTGPGFRQEFRLRLAPGRHELSLLVCALGLIKGDWMIGMANMADERKGLWGKVRWNGRPVKGPWRMRTGLVGERVNLPGDGGALVRWKRAAARRARPLAWYRAAFDRPKGAGPFVLDLLGMTKGLAWVNGRCLGRYWLAPASGERQEWLSQWTRGGSPDEPTQRFYHVPREWIADRSTLILFDELGGDPSGVTLARA
ncbi:MAG: beta-galactosidase [Planctomycetes bacterium]|nr:beta-galactosidase [Planctomycetota bacterium]